MSTSQKIKRLSRKDLLIFAAVLPVFLACLGWLSVRRPGGMLATLIICGSAALIGILVNLKKIKTTAWALFIPVILLALLLLGRSGATAQSLAGAWALVGLLLAAIIALTPAGPCIYTFWIEAAEPIGMVMSTIVLALAFYLVFTPIGWLMRLFGRDPMGLRYDRAASTYWVKHEPVTDPERYFRQF